MEYTNEEIANDWYLWTEYVDPDGVITQEEFEKMTIRERLDFIDKLEE